MVRGDGHDGEVEKVQKALMLRPASVSPPPAGCQSPR